MSPYCCRVLHTSTMLAPRVLHQSVDVYHWHHSIRPAIGPELFAAAAERLLLDSDRQTVAKWFGFPPFFTFPATGLGTDLLTGACNCRNTHTVVYPHPATICRSPSYQFGCSGCLLTILGKLLSCS
jgi:hypothetical protein